MWTDELILGNYQSLRKPNWVKMDELSSRHPRSEAKMVDSEPGSEAHIICNHHFH